MSYDKDGNYDYEAAAMGRQLRAHGGWMRARDGIGRASRVAAVVLCGLLLVAAVVALGVAGDYVRGRVIGAGVRDALEGR